MEEVGWSPHPAATGRALVAVALWEDRDIIMHPTDPVSCFPLGRPWISPGLGPLWEWGVSPALGNPQHGGIGWIQPPKTHQLLVAPYEVVHGHPDGNYCWEQGASL